LAIEGVTVGTVDTVGWQHVCFGYDRISNWAPVFFCHAQTGYGGLFSVQLPAHLKEEPRC